MFKVSIVKGGFKKIMLHQSVSGGNSLVLHVFFPPDCSHHFVPWVSSLCDQTLHSHNKRPPLLQAGYKQLFRHKKKKILSKSLSRVHSLKKKKKPCYGGGYTGERSWRFAAFSLSFLPPNFVGRTKRRIFIEKKKEKKSLASFLAWPPLKHGVWNESCLGVTFPESIRSPLSAQSTSAGPSALTSIHERSRVTKVLLRKEGSMWDGTNPSTKYSFPLHVRCPSGDSDGGHWHSIWGCLSFFLFFPLLLLFFSSHPCLLLLTRDRYLLPGPYGASNNEPSWPTRKKERKREKESLFRLWLFIR